MTLIGRLVRTLSLVRAQHALIEAQQQLIRTQRLQIAQVRLDYTRQMHGVVAAWRIHMETPELDLRDDVSDLAAELANQAATLEEHVV